MRTNEKKKKINKIVYINNDQEDNVLKLD